MSAMSCRGSIGELKKITEFEWKIANFFSLSADKRSFYSSPSFTFANRSFHLSIYPAGKTIYDDWESPFFSVYLEKETGSSLYATCEFGIKDHGESELYKCGTLGNVLIENFVGYDKFLERSFLKEDEYMPSGILSMICRLKLNEDVEQAVRKAENLDEKQVLNVTDDNRIKELDILSKNLKDFLLNVESCDTVLLVKDKEFRAHKAMLMARSSVFSSMFQHDTLEKQTGRINISDCDPDSFQDFLEYLYCGSLEDVSFRNVFHLYSTSDKYNVQELKEFCLKYLMKNLTVDNICDVFILADKYDETELLRSIQDFFNENCNKIFLTTQWENLMRNDYRLAQKLLIGLSKTKESH